MWVNSLASLYLYGGKTFGNGKFIAHIFLVMTGGVVYGIVLPLPLLKIIIQTPGLVV
jgi:hypothetical protein